MIVLSGNPLSTNSLYRYACRGSYPSMYMTAVGKDLKQQYSLEARSQWKKPVTKNSVKVAVKLYFKDRRKRDIDNHNKIFIDSLTGIVWEDDSQIEELIISKHVDKSNPRIEIIVVS